MFTQLYRLFYMPTRLHPTLREEENMNVDVSEVADVDMAEEEVDKLEEAEADTEDEVKIPIH